MNLHLPFIVIIGWLFILVACGLAWRLGGKPERSVAVLVLAMAAIGGLQDMIPDAGLRKFAYLAGDGVMALGLLLLAMRYAVSWLGLAVLLQGVQFSLHAYYLVSDRPYDALYSLVNNLVTIGVLLSLMVGSVLAWRKRRGASAK